MKCCVWIAATAQPGTEIFNLPAVTTSGKSFSKEKTTYGSEKVNPCHIFHLYALGSPVNKEGDENVKGNALHENLLPVL